MRDAWWAVEGGKLVVRNTQGIVAVFGPRHFPNIILALARELKGKMNATE